MLVALDRYVPVIFSDENNLEEIPHRAIRVTRVVTGGDQLYIRHLTSNRAGGYSPPPLWRWGSPLEKIFEILAPKLSV